MKAPIIQKKLNNAAGISVLELLIVVAMISVLSGFALLQIVRTRQVMMRNNAAQQMAAFLEKARLDSVRRRPFGAAQMAQVSIVNATFYSVTIDADGDGTLNAPQVIRLPTGTDFQFNGPFPRTIYFNWRGRTEDAAGNSATPPFVTISSATYGSSRIDLSRSGQPSLEGPLTASPVTNTNPPAASFRPNTQIP